MNSKKKGSGFERDVSKILSKWLSENKSDDCFWRTQSSGGRFTQRLKANKSTYGQEGDVWATNPEYKFFSDNIYLECKFYKDINLWSLITNTENSVYYWWNDTVKKSKQVEKFPVLIAKQNRKPCLWVCDAELSAKITVFTGEKCKLKFVDDTDNISYIYEFDKILRISPKLFKCMLEFSEVVE